MRYLLDGDERRTPKRPATLARHARALAADEQGSARVAARARWTLLDDHPRRADESGSAGGTPGLRPFARYMSRFLDANPSLDERNGVVVVMAAKLYASELSGEKYGQFDPVDVLPVDMRYALKIAVRRSLLPLVDVPANHVGVQWHALPLEPGMPLTNAAAWTLDASTVSAGNGTSIVITARGALAARLRGPQYIKVPREFTHQGACHVPVGFVRLHIPGADRALSRLSANGPLDRLMIDSTIIASP